MKYKIGDKIKFKSEVKRYTVMACDARYLVCVKPFNLTGTFMYTLVDLVDQKRGPDNLLFGIDYDLFDPQDCQDLLVDLQSGKIELSRRRSIPLDIENA